MFTHKVKRVAMLAAIGAIVFASCYIAADRYWYERNRVYWHGYDAGRESVSIEQGIALADDDSDPSAECDR